MKRVLVTGSTRGIGYCVAENLLTAGFDVVLHGRQGPVPEKLLEKHPEIRLIAFDVSDRAQTKEILSSELEKYGAFYGVVLCAGVVRDGPFPACTGEDWDYVLRTNLDGFFNVLQPLVLPMIQLRIGGRIVVLSSLSGIIGNRGQVAYSASKAGLIGASKALSRELAKRSITVNCVAPGPVETEMLSAEISEQMNRVIPMGRAARVEEVSSAVRYLFQEDAAYLTGQVITLSGGLV